MKLAVGALAAFLLVAQRRRDDVSSPPMYAHAFSPASSSTTRLAAVRCPSAAWMSADAGDGGQGAPKKKVLKPADVLARAKSQGDAAEEAEEEAAPNLFVPEIYDDFQSALLKLEKRVNGGAGALAAGEVEDLIDETDRIVAEMNAHLADPEGAGLNWKGGAAGGGEGGGVAVAAPAAPATELASSPAPLAQPQTQTVPVGGYGATDASEDEGPAYDPSKGGGFGLAKGTTNTYALPGMDEMSPEEYRAKLQESISARQAKRREASIKGGYIGNASSSGYLDALGGVGGNGGPGGGPGGRARKNDQGELKDVSYESRSPPEVVGPGSSVELSKEEKLRQLIAMEDKLRQLIDQTSMNQSPDLGQEDTERKPQQPVASRTEVPPSQEEETVPRILEERRPQPTKPNDAKLQTEEASLKNMLKESGTGSVVRNSDREGRRKIDWGETSLKKIVSESADVDQPVPVVRNTDREGRRKVNWGDTALKKIVNESAAADHPKRGTDPEVGRTIEWGETMLKTLSNQSPPYLEAKHAATANFSTRGPIPERRASGDVARRNRPEGQKRVNWVETLLKKLSYDGGDDMIDPRTGERHTPARAARRNRPEGSARKTIDWGESQLTKLSYDVGSSVNDPRTGETRATGVTKNRTEGGDHKKASWDDGVLKRLSYDSNAKRGSSNNPTGERRVSGRVPSVAEGGAKMNSDWDDGLLKRLSYDSAADGGVSNYPTGEKVATGVNKSRTNEGHKRVVWGKSILKKLSPKRRALPEERKRVEYGDSLLKGLSKDIKRVARREAIAEDALKGALKEAILKRFDESDDVVSEEHDEQLLRKKLSNEFSSSSVMEQQRNAEQEDALLRKLSQNSSKKEQKNNPGEFLRRKISDEFGGSSAVEHQHVSQTEGERYKRSLEQLSDRENWMQQWQQQPVVEQRKNRDEWQRHQDLLLSQILGFDPSELRSSDNISAGEVTIPTDPGSNQDDQGLQELVSSEVSESHPTEEISDLSQEQNVENEDEQERNAESENITPTSFKAPGIFSQESEGVTSNPLWWDEKTQRPDPSPILFGRRKLYGKSQSSANDNNTVRAESSTSSNVRSEQNGNVVITSRSTGGNDPNFLTIPPSKLSSVANPASNANTKSTGGNDDGFLGVSQSQSASRSVGKHASSVSSGRRTDGGGTTRSNVDNDTSSGPNSESPANSVINRPSEMDSIIEGNIGKTSSKSYTGGNDRGFLSIPLGSLSSLGRQAGWGNNDGRRTGGNTPGNFSSSLSGSRGDKLYSDSNKRQSSVEAPISSSRVSGDDDDNISKSSEGDAVISSESSNNDSTADNTQGNGISTTRNSSMGGNDQGYSFIPLGSLSNISRQVPSGKSSPGRRTGGNTPGFGTIPRSSLSNIGKNDNISKSSDGDAAISSESSNNDSTADSTQGNGGSSTRNSSMGGNDQGYSFIPLGSLSNISRQIPNGKSAPGRRTGGNTPGFGTIPRSSLSSLGKNTGAKVGSKDNGAGNNKGGDGETATSSLLGREDSGPPAPPSLSRRGKGKSMNQRMLNSIGNFVINADDNTNRGTGSDVSGEPASSGADAWTSDDVPEPGANDSAAARIPYESKDNQSTASNTIDQNNHGPTRTSLGGNGMDFLSRAPSRMSRISKPIIPQKTTAVDWQNTYVTETQTSIPHSDIPNPNPAAAEYEQVLFNEQEATDRGLVAGDNEHVDAMTNDHDGNTQDATVDSLKLQDDEDFDSYVKYEVEDEEEFQEQILDDDYNLDEDEGKFQALTADEASILGDGGDYEEEIHDTIDDLSYMKDIDELGNGSYDEQEVEDAEGFQEDTVKISTVRDYENMDDESDNEDEDVFQERTEDEALILGDGGDYEEEIHDVIDDILYMKGIDELGNSSYDEHEVEDAEGFKEITDGTLTVRDYENMDDESDNEDEDVFQELTDNASIVSNDDDDLDSGSDNNEGRSEDQETTDKDVIEDDTGDLSISSNISSNEEGGGGGAEAVAKKEKSTDTIAGGKGQVKDV